MSTRGLDITANQYPYTRAANVENLTLIGDAAADATGN